MKRRLQALHRELDRCEICPNMHRPAIHGPPVESPVMLIGQAPGPREAQFMRPFAWTAGKTLFSWFEAELGVAEERFRECVYIAAVARCFPGKAPGGGGDRKPDKDEIAACGRYLEKEVAILQPELVLPVGMLATQQVLGARKMKLDEIIGKTWTVTYRGVETDVIPLPHPSGASPWHKLEPGKSLVKKALQAIGRHPAWIKATR